MKNQFLSIAMLALASLGFAACSSDSSSSKGQAEASNAITDSISSGLQKIMGNEDGDFSEGGVIVYDAAEKRFLTCDYRAYALGVLIASGMPEDQSVMDNKDNGRKYAGSCSTELEAQRLSSEINKQIPENTDFEISVEAQKDGTYKAWYKVI